jgi:hypothetical protein
MSDRFIDWLFDTLISVDVQHQELLRGFGVLLLIPFALFLLSYVCVSFAFTKDRARKGGKHGRFTQTMKIFVTSARRDIRSCARHVRQGRYLFGGCDILIHPEFRFDLTGNRPLWVKSRHFAQTSCPLYPRQQPMSALGQKRTSIAQLITAEPAHA